METLVETASAETEIFLENFDTETVGEQKVLHSPMRKLNLFYAKARSGKDGRINS